MRQYLLLLPLLALSACDLGIPPTTNPDYTIRVLKTSSGSVAIPPNCPSAFTSTVNPFDEQPLPQYGCAHARNLAMMVEQPDDLVKGRDLGEARSVLIVGSVRRYDNNQTRGLIWTGTDSNAVAVTSASTTSSLLTGDATGTTASTTSSNTTGP